MKKFLLLFTVFALILASCDEDNEPNNSDNADNSDVIGIWTATYGTAYQLKLDIEEAAWIMVFNDAKGPTTFNGNWERQANTMDLIRKNYSQTGSASLSGDKLYLTQNFSTGWADNFITRPKTITLSKSTPIVISGTKLTIKNESFLDITDVRWNNTAFTTGTGTIKNGNSVLKSVSSGSGYIFFKVSGNPVAVRTNEVFVIEKDEEKEIVITDNTVIVDVNNTGNTDTLRTFFIKPWIILKQGNTVINQYGEYSFGNILTDTEKDVTFTIENTGRESLDIISVSGKRVNIDGFNPELFSVIQQPLASSISPGSSASFIIRFNPKVIGNNYIASVHIKTNSMNAQEFAFAIKGNGRNFIIGDTGPGGGTVFYAQGNQFKECSAELGKYNWNDAISIAGSYNGGGFSDWYLPDRGELDLMYRNLHIKSLGGFLQEYYWSSSEYDTTAAYYLHFSSGYYNFSYKTAINRVRAVRSFAN